jgi:CBS domain-containing protein
LRHAARAGDRWFFPHVRGCFGLKRTNALDPREGRGDFGSALEEIPNMNVEKLMTTEVTTCSPDDTLQIPAQRMWENDCGFLPVVDRERRVVGVITDRDICMAAYLKGVPLGGASVTSAMSPDVYSCSPHATLGYVEELMRTHRIRRVPVVDALGRLVGIITLSDLARRAQAKSALQRALGGARIAGILAHVSTPREPRAAAAE